MSEENVKGTFEKIGGRIKEAAGALTGDEKLKSEGQFDQAKGGVHQAWGDVKDAAKDLASRLHESTVKTEDAPVVTDRSDLP
jgi:uncharacterized protein YjbJ (UPF0337 family)